MTLSTKCKCGAEFYISYAEENDIQMVFAEDKFNKFLSLHKGCCNIELDDLPEDWKV